MSRQARVLFNSIEFLLIFLPLTLAVYLRISDARVALAWLCLASLFFYGYWNPVYLLLIISSVAANYTFGRLIRRSVEPRKYWITAAGVTFNLALLGYFKYANFFVREFASATGSDWSIDMIVLPLAISFFTFQQIAYLVDYYQDKVEPHGAMEYLAFVVLFPQLIAGPIVHQRHMLPQFRAIKALREVPGNLAIGLTIFAIGLFKKVAIADELALYADPVFGAAELGGAVSMAEAWGGAVCYTFQLYFDFSGYSDMAIGLGRMFGITLPVNFASPYKARSIIDFWRAWHITLSNFLRDYLYIPLGGNRYGTFDRYRNLMITMLLGGLWHGAGWTFVIWGGLHGFYLVVNNLWRGMPVYPRVAGLRFYDGSAWALTLLAVMFSWVFFRAGSLDAAWLLIKSMVGLNGIDLPRTLAQPLGTLFDGSVRVDGFFPNIDANWYLAMILSLMAAVLALFGPNVFDLFQGALQGRMNSRVPYRGTAIVWKSNGLWAGFAGAMFAYCLLSLNEPSEFLYFQF
jgi:alginate O-acetyltransferase complex protein AlgI